MSKEGNDYRDEFIRAMDDLRFRLAHKDEVEVLEAGGNGLTIRHCFFNGICGYSEFHEFCSSYHTKAYDDDPGFIDEILECALRRFFNKKWEQEKYCLLACDFDIEQAKKYCIETVKLIAAAYVGRLRELYDYHELIETDYFSSNIKYLNGGVYSKHFLRQNYKDDDEEDEEDYKDDDEEDEEDYE